MTVPDPQLAALLTPDVEQMLRAHPEEIAEALDEFHAADLAEIAQRLSPELRTRLLKALPAPQAAEIIEYLDEETGLRAVAELGPTAAGQLLENMSADDRADLVASLPEEVAAPVLAAVEPEARRETQRLLAYGRNTAGGLMTPDFVRLPPAVTVGEALGRIRKGANDKETVYAVYVTDETGRLLGVASLRELLASEDRMLLQDIMTERVMTVAVNTDQEEVARVCARYDLLAVPVVEAGVILGIVTVDDVLDVLVEEGIEDVQRIGAAEPLDVPYFAAGFLTVIRARAGWLSLIFLAEMFTGTVLQHFEHELQKVISLVLFIPLIISSGGNAGSQSSTVIIRALALGEVRIGDFRRVLNRETAAGLGMGCVLGLIGALRAALWGLQGSIMLTVGVSLLVVVMAGTIFGAVLPLGLKRIGADPALTSAPAIASLVDVTGILAYLLLARLFVF
jgi:magnesium transporter